MSTTKTCWRTRELTIEVIVGVFMFTVLLGLAYFTIVLSRGKLLGQDYSMEVVFQDVMGLREGDSVVVRGMTVGDVEGLHFSSHGVRAILSLKQDIALKTDYKVMIIPTSLLGGRHVRIHEGSSASARLLPGKKIVGETPYDLVAEAGEVVHEIKKAFMKKDGIIDNLEVASAEMNIILARLNRGEGSLGKALSSDASLYDDLSSTVASLKVVAGRLERGDGSIGKLLAEEDMYNDARDLVNETRATVDDLRETSPIVSFSSVFFGAF